MARGPTSKKLRGEFGDKKIIRWLALRNKAWGKYFILVRSEWVMENRSLVLVNAGRVAHPHGFQSAWPARCVTSYFSFFEHKDCIDVVEVVEGKSQSGQIRQSCPHSTPSIPSVLQAIPLGSASEVESNCLVLMGNTPNDPESVWQAASITRAQVQHLQRFPPSHPKTSQTA
jgi:hypothetical protein